MNNQILKRALQNLKRSGWRAYAVIFMMSVTFVILGILLTIMYTSQNLVNYFVQKPEVIGFFNDDVSEEQILNLKKEIETKDFVAEVTYRSKEEAMKSFLEANKEDENLVNSVTSNPFPAHLNVKAKSLDQLPMISEIFNNSDLIYRVESLEGVVDTLKMIVFGIQAVALTLLIIFTISTFIIIFLTVGITIYAHKNEIIIMKLVGATNWYVSAPYFIQSSIYAIISVMISSAILIPILYTQYGYLLSTLVGGLSISGISAQILAIGVAIELLFALLLAFFSSYFATRRYINQ